MSPPRRTDAVLLAITALWGTTFAVIQQGLAHANTFSFLAVRFAIGAAALAVIARLRVIAWRSNLVGFALGALSFVGFALQTGGLNYTTASRSAFLTGLTVVLVPTVVGLLGRKPARSTWAAACLALAGLALMTRPTSADGLPTLRGDLLTLGCTVAFGLSILLSERYAPHHPVFPMVFGHLVGIGTLSTIGALASGWRLESCPALWESLAFCGVVASAICLAGQTYAMKTASATRAALIYALEPVFAASFAYAYRGDALGRAELLGGGLIVAATLVEPVRSMWPASARSEPQL